MIVIGLRREPHPPMPIVIPSRSSATTSASVVLLSATSVRLLDEGVPSPVALAGQVELEGEALLEAVAALHVDGVDAVERLLGRPDHRRALLGDGPSHLEGGVSQLVPGNDLQ